MFIATNLPKQKEPINIVDFLYLAEIVARKYYRGKDNIRDTELFSIACQELVKCSEKYDLTIGPFDRYAMRAMRNGIIQQIRLRNCKKRVAQFEPLTEQQWQDFPKENKEIEFPTGILETILKCHPEESEQDQADKELLKDVYLNLKQITEISEQLGVSRVTIYNRLKRILGKLRKKFEDVLCQ